MKPVPEIAIALTVTAEPPVDVNCRDCVAGLFTVTFPNAIAFELIVRIGAVGLNCSATVFIAVPRVAESVVVCVEETAATVAVNVPLDAPAGTATVAGSVTAALLLDRLTTTPPAGAAALNVTVQASEPAPENELLAQVNALRAATLPPVLCAGFN